MRWVTAMLAGLLWLPSVLPARAAEEKSAITISADSLEVNQKTRTAVYRGNVAANDRSRGVTILADRIEFFFDEKMQDLDRALANGNVRLSYGERRGVAERAEYFPGESRAVLIGHPKVWQDNDVVTGCRIVLFLREDRSRVEGCEGERVNAVLYPKRGEGAPPVAPRR
jgi:lipopolysaccharide export system protein LptA